MHRLHGRALAGILDFRCRGYDISDAYFSRFYEKLKRFIKPRAFRRKILGYDTADYDLARYIWWHHRNKKTKGRKPLTDRAIYQTIEKAAKLGMWEVGEKTKAPSETQVRTWIKKYWEPMARLLPKDETVLPWRETNGPEPARIRTLTVLFDLASKIWAREKVDDPEMESEFPGFSNDVCDWAWNLSGFFDLTVSRDCIVLLDFAYDFADEAKYRRAFDEPMPARNEKYDRLMIWNSRLQDPDRTNRIRDQKGVVSIPIWEQANEGDMEWTVASKLKGEPWLLYEAEYAGRLVRELEVVQPEDFDRRVNEIQEPETASDAPVGLLVAQPEDVEEVVREIQEETD